MCIWLCRCTQHIPGAVGGFPCGIPRLEGWVLCIPGDTLCPGTRTWDPGPPLLVKCVHAEEWDLGLDGSRVVPMDQVPPPQTPPTLFPPFRLKNSSFSVGGPSLRQNRTQRPSLIIYPGTGERQSAIPPLAWPAAVAAVPEAFSMLFVVDPPSLISAACPVWPCSVQWSKGFVQLEPITVHQGMSRGIASLNLNAHVLLSSQQ